MNLKNILIPLDESEKTFDSLETVKALFRPEDVTITLLHIVDNYDVVTTNPLDPEAPKELSKEIINKGASKLEGYNVNTISILGSHASVVVDILTAIEKNNIDLVVMTKTGKGFFDRYIVGSVTSHIIKRSPAPVIVVP